MATKSKKGLSKIGVEMKVLLITRTMAFGGGAESLVYEVYKRMQVVLGAQNVMLITFEHSSIFNFEGIDLYEKELEMDPHFLICTSSVQLKLKGKSIINNKELSDRIRAFEPTVIHSHLFRAELYSRSVDYPSAKWFSHFHDNMVQFNNFSLKTLQSKRLLANFVEKNYLFSRYRKNRGNHFIAISTDTLSFAKQTCGNYPVTLLKNAVNVGNFRRYEKVKFDKIRIVNVGNFVQKKNQQFFISIAKELLKTTTNFEIVLLGYGELKEELIQKIMENNLTPYFVFAGVVKDVNKYLNQANIYVHTAKYEPFGLVLLEAMACGLPVVSLDGIGNRDIVLNDQNGFLISEEDPTMFADKISELYSNRELYTKISSFAERFVDNYGIEKYVDQLLRIYQN